MSFWCIDLKDVTIAIFTLSRVQASRDYRNTRSCLSSHIIASLEHTKLQFGDEVIVCTIKTCVYTQDSSRQDVDEQRPVGL